MTRWTLLACCLLLGACRTVTPPARPDAGASGGKAAASGGPGSSPAAVAKPEPVRSGFTDPAGRADARDSVSATPAAAAVQPAGITSSQPAERAALAPPGVGNLPAAESVAKSSPEPLRVPGRREALPARPVEQLALPSLPVASRGDAHAAEALPLPAGPLTRYAATNAASSLPVPALRGGVPQDPRPAQTLELPFRGRPPAGQPEPRPVSRQIGLASAAPPAAPGPSVEPVALPWLPAVRQGEAGAGRVLPLPALLPASPGVTNSAASSSLPVAPWVADAQKESDRIAAELERRARTQQEHEEQFQNLRRAFYRFLSVSPGE
ncbi:MAG: hypothetical protein WCI17_11160 [bacterium]